MYNVKTYSTMKHIIIDLTKEEEMQIFGGKIIYKIVIIDGKQVLLAEVIPD